MSLRIRPAESGDLPWLLEQLRAFDVEFGARLSLFPDAEFARTRLVCWMDPDSGCFLVAERGGVRVGFLVGMLTPHPYNPAIRTLVELLWWVAPAWRASAAGAALLDAYLHYGRAHADWIVLTHRDTRPARPALERRGLVSYERSYLLEV